MNFLAAYHSTAEKRKSIGFDLHSDDQFEKSPEYFYLEIACSSLQTEREENYDKPRVSGACHPSRLLSRLLYAKASIAKVTLVSARNSANILRLHLREGHLLTQLPEQFYFEIALKHF